MKSNKHRAEVIEIYENGLRAAVKFSSGRVECVVRRGMAEPFEMGQTGWVDYGRCLGGFEWSFTPFKRVAKAKVIAAVTAALVLSACGRAPAVGDPVIPTVSDSTVPAPKATQVAVGPVGTPVVEPTATPTPVPSSSPTPSPSPTPAPVTVVQLNYMLAAAACGALNTWDPVTTTLVITNTSGQVVYTFAAADITDSNLDGSDSQVIPILYLHIGEQGHGAYCEAIVTDGKLTSFILGSL